MLIRELVGQTFGQRWHYQYLQVERVPFAWHYHPEFELTLTRRARGMRYVGGDVASFGELDLVLVAPNQAHTWQAQSRADGQPQEVQVIFFTREWLEQLAAIGLPELMGFCEWLRGVQQGVEFSPACIQRLLPLFDRLHQTSGLERLSCLLQIFGQIPRDHDARLIGGTFTPDTQDKRIETALAWLHAHYREPVTLADLAAETSTSEATIKRLLREQLHDSMTGLLSQLRIGHACNLLITTQMPIQLIAEESGFPSPSHFYKQFGIAKGLSPAAFRKRFHLRRAATSEQEYGPVDPALVLAGSDLCNWHQVGEAEDTFAKANKSRNPRDVVPASSWTD
ncbi:helix-turn-helix domain-containing protein [Silvimonas soli]|uniref:helix-turn-helix domain-containing protein n=1 Tax=Silvimonas soli TaxID=2980100 RepID=UPI0024B339E5|nr:AraC family transcriptional regulator [Silvimonas soli]